MIYASELKETISSIFIQYGE